MVIFPSRFETLLLSGGFDHGPFEALLWALVNILGSETQLCLRTCLVCLSTSTSHGKISHLVSQIDRQLVS